jgi:hypothetical protein
MVSHSIKITNSDELVENKLYRASNGYFLTRITKYLATITSLTHHYCVYFKQPSNLLPEMLILVQVDRSNNEVN